MKLFILLVIGFALLGCREESPRTASQMKATPACDGLSTVERRIMDETARGYDYRFHVYLPPCYETETWRRYPVLYLIPGRGSGPDDWFNAGADQVAEDLILSGQLPPMLIVTTENTESDPQADTIFNELLPHIEGNYRVLAERQYRATAGGSLGGIGAYRLAFQHPGLFASVGLFGSGVVHGEEQQVQSWLQGFSPEMRPRVFLNTGEQDPLMLERAKAMIALLEPENIEATTLFSPGDHSYSYWASNLPTFYRWLAVEWE